MHQWPYFPNLLWQWDVYAVLISSARNLSPGALWWPGIPLPWENLRLLPWLRQTYDVRSHNQSRAAASSLWHVKPDVPPWSSWPNCWTHCPLSGDSCDEPFPRGWGVFHSGPNLGGPFLLYPKDTSFMATLSPFLFLSPTCSFRTASASSAMALACSLTISWSITNCSPWALTDEVIDPFERKSCYFTMFSLRLVYGFYQVFTS